MRICINGEDREIGGSRTLLDLLEDLGVGTDGIAIELNREVVGKSRWRETGICEGDNLEIVRFVGGG